ncbi:MAG: hypothetical protein A2V67_10420 [Deltaproteobacteria bacterium RBG_13_61_14]|nr:MAG: hypothetical protein A2V67_10420 [Deltaproteobacteria bacterium RBG_13_61_14]
MLLMAIPAWTEVWPEGRPLTLAHRGANREFDENTLAAFSRAADLGVDAIECDPKLTRDGVYVIMHDFTVDRTTDGSGKVAEMTLSEIKSLRTKNGEEVPTLEEVLQLAQGRGLAVYLDMKSAPPDRGEKLVALLDQYGMRDRGIVGTYQKQFTRELERRWPDLVTFVSWPYPALTMGQVRRTGADGFGTLAGFATKHRIAKAHKKGLKVATMPVDDQAKLLQQKQIGLDVLQTDEPKLLPK